MKKVLLITAAIIFATNLAFGQGAAINATGNAADNSAILDVQSDTVNYPRGFLMPRMSTTKRNAILSPAEGLQIYNLTTKCFEAYVNSAWNIISCPACTTPSAPVASAASNITCTSFTANWAAVTGAVSYYLDVSTDVAFGSFLTGYNNKNVGSNLSENITGLTNGTIFYYRVRAFNYCGTSTNSNTITSTLSVHYLPITLTNNQSSATPANFQQMITVNSSTYSAYESSGLENVEFTTGPGATGTVLQAWIESGANSAATSTVYWVNLGSSTIAGSGGTLTIYMNFMPNNVMSATGPTGEAPQLSATYGQYDNGANVFITYCGFVGSSLCPSVYTYTYGGSESIVANNGYTMTITSSGAGSHAYLYASIPSQYAPYVTETYATSSSGGRFGASTSTNMLNGWYNGAWRYVPYNSEMGQFATAGNPVSGVWVSSGSIGGTSNTPAVNATYPGIYSFVWVATGNETEMVNYTNSSSTDATVSYSSTSYSFFGNGAETGASGTTTGYWLRTRIYEPGGVMPGVSFGAVTC